jgi:hypothetical protein
MENCNHGNFAPVDKLDLLPVSQAGIERHKCVICAYQGGFRIGIQRIFTNDIPTFPIRCKHGKTAPEYLILELPESQAGTGRHKCAICAFQDGLIDGIERGSSMLLEENKPVLGYIERVDIPVSVSNPFGINKRKFTSRKNIDYKKADSERASLGYLGEQLVFEHERNLLIKNHLSELVSKIQHTSVLEGDGSGFDILSFTFQGEPKYIEVKTTSSHIDTPFYMSANELEFSKLNSTSYYLYRVFNLNEKERKGKYYIYQGDVTKEFHINPINYQVAR